jgi:hypothetical protein
MAETLYEEATRCPFGCETPGRLAGTTRPQGPRGPKIETWECINDRCEMSGERWQVQVNADGTIPPKGSGSIGPKAFDINQATTPQERQRARDYMRQLEERAVQGGREF